MGKETRMRVALKESVQRTYDKAITLRPKNTKRTYVNRQQEFLDWCSAKGPAFNDLTRFTVTGEKLHLCLEEGVIGRVKRHKSGSKNSERIETVGRSTVNSFVAAMVDLWKQQSRANVNCNPSPRDEAVTTLLKLTHFGEDERKRKIRGPWYRHTLGWLYYCRPDRKDSAIFLDPGTRFRQTAAEFGCFPVESYCVDERGVGANDGIGDLHSLTRKNEGYTPSKALVMVMRQGKTNQVGRIEVGACMRNKNVEICPHGMLGFYLFWRWHVDGEAFPDFSSSENWYPIKLLKTGKDATKAMSYKVHSEAITAALKHIGVHSKAKTHIGRGSESRMADLGGASESQIRRLGRWNNQAMEKCYLTSLSREAMRTLAGFEPSKGSVFARASVEPPLALHSRIFPQIGSWQQAINAGTAEQSLATGGFLELLQYFRKVVLQDAVLLQKCMPSYPIWRHDIFISCEFKQFSSEAATAMDTMENSSEQRLQKALPLLNAKLDGVHQDLKHSLNQVFSEMRSIGDNLRNVMDVLGPLQVGTAVVQVQLLPGNQANNHTSTPLVASTPDPSTASPTFIESHTLHMYYSVP